MKESPEFATFCGIHDYDDKLDDSSLAGYMRRQVKTHGTGRIIVKYSALEVNSGVNNLRILALFLEVLLLHLIFLNVSFYDWGKNCIFQEAAAEFLLRTRSLLKDDNLDASSRLSLRLLENDLDVYTRGLSFQG